MRKSLLILILLLVFLNSSVFANGRPDTWAMKEIEALDELNIVDSMLDSFDDEITRLELTRLSVKMYELMTDSIIYVNHNSPIPFRDSGHESVSKAFSIDLANGVGDGFYDPNGKVNREQIATMFIRLLNILEVETNTNINISNKFNDHDNISEWARENVYFAKENNIINGVGDNQFNPKGSATKQTAFIIATRILEKYDGKLAVDPNGNSISIDISKYKSDSQKDIIEADGYKFAISKGEKYDYEKLIHFSEKLMIVDNYGLYGLIDKNKNVILENKYDNIYSLEEPLIAADKNGKSAIYNVETMEFITDFAYDSFFMFEKNIIVSKDNKSALMSSQGELITDYYFYLDVLRHSELLRIKNEAGKYGLVNRNDEILIDTIYDDIYEVNHSIFKVSKNDEVSYIDLRGFEYDAIEVIGENLVFASKGDDHELIIGNESFRETIALDSASQLIYGYSIIEADGLYGLVSAKGEIVSMPHYDDLKTPTEGIMVFKKNNQYGFLNLKTKESITTVYKDIISFSDGYAAVTDGSKWGFINLKGELVIDLVYDAAGYFSEGLANVKKGSQWGYVKENGQVATDFKYDLTSPLRKGIGNVRKGVFVGAVDSTGKEVIEPLYHWINTPGYKTLSDNHMIAKYSDYYFIIDKSGRVIINDQTKEIPNTSGDLYYTRHKNGTRFLNLLYDKNGKELQFGLVSHNYRLSDNIIRIIPSENDQNYFYYYDHNNNDFELIDGINNMSYNLYGMLYVASSVNNKTRNKTSGLADSKGNIILPLQYDTLIKSVYNTYIAVKGNIKYTIEILETPYGSYDDFVAKFTRPINETTESYKDIKEANLQNISHLASNLEIVEAKSYPLYTYDYFTWKNNHYIGLYDETLSMSDTVTILDDMLISGNLSTEYYNSGQGASQTDLLDTEGDRQPTIKIRSGFRLVNSRILRESLKFLTGDDSDGEKIHKYLKNAFDNRIEISSVEGNEKTFGNTRVIIIDPEIYGVDVKFPDLKFNEESSTYTERNQHLNTISKNQ